MNHVITQHIKQYLDSPNSSPSKTLWLVDENIESHLFDNTQQKYAHVKVITNRYDQFSKLKAQAWDVEFDDFTLLHTPNSIDCIIYRVAKEKDQVHYVINQAGKILSPSGKLILIGQKQEGIKTYYKKAQSYFADSTALQKHGQIYIGELTKKANLGQELIQDNYPCIRPAIHWEDQTFLSKPGVFGWDKIDNGSALLVEALKKLLSTPSSPSIQPSVSTKECWNILDLGCGYGFLSLTAHQVLQQLKPNIEVHLTATDNNAAAIQACHENFLNANIEGRVTASDCGDSLPPNSFDVILCNPPFHQGFSPSNQLTEHFLQKAQSLLKPQGIALFVVNEFIPLEKKALSLFQKAHEIMHNKQFKVILLNK